MGRIFAVKRSSKPMPRIVRHSSRIPGVITWAEELADNADVKNTI